MKAEVAAKYDLAKDAFIKAMYPKFGELDLNELTLEAADILVADGFDALVPKKVKGAKEPKPETTEA
jgi:hypothetical protein